jgi:glycosyltransferase involved in cell wall biosynthesis
MNELVSVVVPCYNQAIFLDEALDSVFNQTHENWECIIVNDGSPDNTEVIAKSWCKKDERFKYIYQDNQGLCAARNRGVSESNGRFILPLDADDFFSRQYMSQAVSAFQKNSRLKVVYCKAQKFGMVEGIWQLPSFSLQALSRNNMIFQSAMYKKTDWEAVGGYDIQMKYGWEDWEFWISMLKYEGEVLCLDHVGFFYRIRENSMLQKITPGQSKYLLEYLSVKHADFFVREYGSFKYMEQQLELLHKQYEELLKSKKFVLDIFCRTFIGIKVFSKYQKYYESRKN